MEDSLLPVVSGFRVPLLLMTHFIGDSPRSFFSSPLSLFPPPTSLFSHMSFSTDFQPPFHCISDHHYDYIYSAYPEPPQDRIPAEAANLEHSLVVPEFANSTPLNLFDRDGGLVKAAPHWCWEAARSMVIPQPRYSEYSDGILIPSLEDVGGVICGAV